jgi:hypothetical protein
MANVQSGLSKFPWKRKGRKLHKLVADLLNAYQTIQCNAWLKMHSLLFLFNFSTPNLVTVSDEHGEGFLRVFPPWRKVMQESRTKYVSWNLCWNLTEDVLIASYKRMSYKKTFKIWANWNIFHIFFVIAWGYFHIAFLPTFLNFLCSFQHEKMFLNHWTQLHSCRF